MDKDNVRLALWISGAWGLVIIIIVGIEAIVHDGDIAANIVDTFSKVLFGLAAILGAVTGVSKWFEAKVATNPVAAATTAAAMLTPNASANEPTNDTAGAGAVDVPGENI